MTFLLRFINNKIQKTEEDKEEDEEDEEDEVEKDILGEPLPWVNYCFLG